MTTSTNDRDVLYTATPSTRPLWILIGILGIFVVSVILYLDSNPAWLEPHQINQGIRFVLGAGVLLGFYLLGQVFFRTRTSYVITNESIERHYQFAGRKKRRVLPFDQLRGYELDQTRTESIFGYGSIVFLSGGTNQSLGYLQFEAIPTPNNVEEQILPHLP